MFCLNKVSVFIIIGNGVVNNFLIFFHKSLETKGSAVFCFAQCQKDLDCRDATIDINEHVAIINCRIIKAI